MDDEDDLLTPYKEESVETYEQKMRESKSYASDSSVSGDYGSDGELRSSAKRARQMLNGNRKRLGRPRKVQVESATEEQPVAESCAEVAATAEKEEIAVEKDTEVAAPQPQQTETVKRRPGRPLKTEITANSQKRMLQSMKFIIPDGIKRKSRPSRMLIDTDAIPIGGGEASSNGSEPSDEKPKKRGRPRVHPPKVRVLQSDGTPRGRGRPRVHPIDPNKKVRIRDPGEPRRRRGRPRTRPIRDPTEVRKRGRKPGPQKRLGRPPKGQEKWRLKLNKINNKLAAFAENDTSSNLEDLSWTMVERSFVQSSEEKPSETKQPKTSGVELKENRVEVTKENHIELKESPADIKKPIGATQSSNVEPKDDESDESSSSDDESDSSDDDSDDDSGDDSDDGEDDSDDDDDSSESSTGTDTPTPSNKTPEAPPINKSVVDVNGIAPVDLSSSDDDDEEQEPSKDCLPSDKTDAAICA